MVGGVGEMVGGGGGEGGGDEKRERTEALYLRAFLSLGYSVGSTKVCHHVDLRKRTEMIHQPHCQSKRTEMKDAL